MFAMLEKYLPYLKMVLELLNRFRLQIGAGSVACLALFYIPFYTILLSTVAGISFVLWKFEILAMIPIPNIPIPGFISQAVSGAAPVVQQNGDSTDSSSLALPPGSTRRVSFKEVLTSKDQKTKQHRKSVPSRPLLEQSNTAIIATAATETRAGAVMLIPKLETILFYSIDWSGTLHFPNEPDKIEMVNALLALHIFDSKVPNFGGIYGYGGTKLVFKMGNRALEGKSTEKSKKFHDFVDRVQSKLDLLYGTFQMVTELDKDPELRIANQLCKEDFSTKETLPKLTSDNPSYKWKKKVVNVSNYEYANFNNSFFLVTVRLYLPELLQAQQGDSANKNKGIKSRLRSFIKHH